MTDSAAPAQDIGLPKLSLDWLVLAGGILSLTIAVLATVLGPEQSRTVGSLEITPATTAEG